MDLDQWEVSTQLSPSTTVMSSQTGFRQWAAVRTCLNKVSWRDLLGCHFLLIKLHIEPPLTCQRLLSLHSETSGCSLWIRGWRGVEIFYKQENILDLRKAAQGNSLTRAVWPSSTAGWRELNIGANISIFSPDFTSTDRSFCPQRHSDSSRKFLLTKHIFSQIILFDNQVFCFTNAHWHLLLITLRMKGWKPSLAAFPEPSVAWLVEIKLETSDCQVLNYSVFHLLLINMRSLCELCGNLNLNNLTFTTILSA